MRQIIIAICLLILFGCMQVADNPLFVKPSIIPLEDLFDTCQVTNTDVFNHRIYKITNAKTITLRVYAQRLTIERDLLDESIVSIDDDNDASIHLLVGPAYENAYYLCLSQGIELLYSYVVHETDPNILEGLLLQSTAHSALTGYIPIKVGESYLLSYSVYDEQQVHYPNIKFQVDRLWEDLHQEQEELFDESNLIISIELEINGE